MLINLTKYCCMCVFFIFVEIKFLSIWNVLGQGQGDHHLTMNATNLHVSAFRLKKIVECTSWKIEQKIKRKHRYTTHNCHHIIVSQYTSKLVAGSKCMFSFYIRHGTWGMTFILFCWRPFLLNLPKQGMANINSPKARQVFCGAKTKIFEIPFSFFWNFFVLNNRIWIKFGSWVRLFVNEVVMMKTEENVKPIGITRNRHQLIKLICIWFECDPKNNRIEMQMRNVFEH